MIKSFKIFENKTYGYHYRYSKRDVSTAIVIKNSYKDPKIKNEIDPYDEEDWDDNSPKSKRWYDLKDYDFNLCPTCLPCVIEFNTCGYGGSDAPKTFTKFKVEKHVIDALSDENCIGFNSDAPYIRNEASENYIHQKGIWNLFPVYKKEYVWEYNDDFILSHATETREPIRISEEDWNTFVDIMKGRGYRWPNFEDKGIKKRSEITYDNSKNLFGRLDKGNEYIYITLYGGRNRFAISHFKLDRFCKYWIDFKEILEGKATYYKKDK